MPTRHDPSTYRRLSEPFPSPDACNAAIDAFMEEVGAARVRHGIRDVLVIVAGSVTYPDGEAEYMTSGGMGDSTRQPVLAAHALGMAEAEARERLNLTRSRAGRRKEE